MKEPAGIVPPAVRYRVIFGTAYLAGLLAGSLGYAFLGQGAKTYAKFFREALLELLRASEPLQIFSSQYLAAFLQLSLTALCGLCALGMPLLLFQLSVRGAVFGCFCAALLTEYRLQGALIAGVLFWLPEVLQVLLQILLSISALRSALQLGRLCFGKSASRRSETPHRLINCYLTVCFAALIPSALSALLALLFGPLAGG